MSGSTNGRLTETAHRYGQTAGKFMKICTGACLLERSKALLVAEQLRLSAIFVHISGTRVRGIHSYPSSETRLTFPPPQQEVGAQFRGDIDVCG
jgi:hypothetical protein